MKTLVLASALCCIAMAQEQKLPEITGQTVELPPELQAARAARIAGYIEQMRAFAEKAFAEPALIERTAREARAKALARDTSVLFDRAAHMAEQLYQIQEEFGLNAAVRVAQIMASLPTASRGPIVITTEVTK